MAYYNLKARDGTWVQTNDPLRVAARLFETLGGGIEMVLSDYPQGVPFLIYTLEEVADAAELLLRPESRIRPTPAEARLEREAAA